MDNRSQRKPTPYAALMPLDTSPENPVPVRKLSQMVGSWIDRLGSIWVEGQVAQISRRPGQSTVFVTLRDSDADLSMQVTCAKRVLDAALPAITEGDRVVLWAKPSFYAQRGSFSLNAREIRHVGLGELLARIERLKAQLAAEGLFAPERKKPLPFLPRRIGLVCGRASAAETDVVENAKRRWPGIAFAIREVAVQGPTAAAGVTAAIKELDADSSIDVIVITRGGGSTEDLLPFSEEGLVRAVATCATPVVSAIGHEQDSPLLDLVADVRASTPTDAARRLVPDLANELAGVQRATERIRTAMSQKLRREQDTVQQLRSRPVLTAPQSMIEGYREVILAARDRSRRAIRTRLDRAGDDLQHTRARVTALSPQATLDRGYALVQLADGAIVREPVPRKSELRIRVARGIMDAVTTSEP